MSEGWDGDYVTAGNTDQAIAEQVGRKAMSRELWIIESRHVPTEKEWHPLILDGVNYTKKSAEWAADKHARKYPNEPTRIVRYVPDEVEKTSDV